MLKTRAIVVQVYGDKALVEAAKEGSCGLCNGKGCGSGNLSQLFCTKPRRFQAFNPAGAKAGEEVMVTVLEGAVVISAMILYGLPLLFLLIGALLGEYSEGSDLGAAVGATAGGVTGFALAYWLAKQRYFVRGPAIIGE